MKVWQKNLILIVLAVLLAALPLRLLPNADFGGAAGAGGIRQIGAAGPVKMRVVGAARFRFAAARTTHSSSFAAPAPSVAMARGVPAAAANGSAWRFMPRKARLGYAERAWGLERTPGLCGERLGYAEGACTTRSARRCRAAGIRPSVQNTMRISRCFSSYIQIKYNIKKHLDIMNIL